MFDRIKKGDIKLLHFLNDSIRCKVLDFIMPIITFLGSARFVMIFCAVTLFSPFIKMKTIGKLTTISICISSILAYLIKRFIHRIRPYINFPHLNIRKIGVDDYSFPSGHTTAAFSISTSLALVFSSFGLGIVVFFIASLVGMSRIYLGVHYPTDVVAGMVLGTLTTYVVYLIK